MRVVFKDNKSQAVAFASLNNKFIIVHIVDRFQIKVCGIPLFHYIKIRDRLNKTLRSLAFDDDDDDDDDDDGVLSSHMLTDNVLLWWRSKYDKFSLIVINFINRLLVITNVRISTIQLFN